MKMPPVIVEIGFDMLTWGRWYHQMALMADMASGLQHVMWEVEWHLLTSEPYR